MAPDAGPANRVFDVFFTSVPFLGSQGRHKGAEATKMMPKLPQRVHKLVWIETQMTRVIDNY